MLDWHSCQICNPHEIKILLLLHIDKEQGKTKQEAPRSVNYIATQNKNNVGTTALERSVVYTTGGWGRVERLSLYKLHPVSRYNS